MQTPSSTAWILAIGTELTLGQSVDTNSAWLARQLAARGIRTVHHATVADESADILAALALATATTELLLITGGLGPTADDLTRAALAEAAGVDLQLHEPSLAALHEFFRKRGRELPAANRVQAFIPLGGEALPNTCGTAPGIALKLGRTAVYALPGVPSEMRAMFEQSIAPRLHGDGNVIRSRRLNCFGRGEAEIGAAIADLMRRGRNPEVGTTAELGVVGIRVNARAESIAAADTLLDQTEAELRHLLGDVIFGSEVQTLADAVAQLLLDRGDTLAIAESCTGGWLGKELTDIPGSSRWFRGGVVCYANEVKEQLVGVQPETLHAQGAVSAAVAEQLAAGIQTRLGATYGIGITGIAGPGGGSPEKPVGLVFIGLAGPTGCKARELRFGDDTGREVIRLRAVRTALNLLRLELLRANHAAAGS